MSEPQVVFFVEGIYEGLEWVRRDNQPPDAHVTQFGIQRVVFGADSLMNLSCSSGSPKTEGADLVSFSLVSDVGPISNKIKTIVQNLFNVVEDWSGATNGWWWSFVIKMPVPAAPSVLNLYSNYERGLRNKRTDVVPEGWH